MDTPHHPKLLGIDYGTRRIGVATNFASLVEPLEVVANQLDEMHPVLSAAALARLRVLCQELHIEALVVGMSEAKMAEQINAFVEVLRQELALPIHLMDETLSSQAVAARLREAGARLVKRQGPIDHYSAAVILEEFLEVGEVN